MKTWFDEKRMDMLNSACEQVLSPQVQDALSFADVIQLAGLLESHNNESVRRNAVADLSQHDVDIGAELRQAIVAEVVADFDNKTIGNFTWGAEKEHVLDLSEEDVDITPLKPAYVGDKLAVIPEKMRKILNYFPDDGKGFVLATPLMISVLQSAAKSVFAQSTEGTFRGPNNTMLVGHIDLAPVYSYLPSYSFGTTSTDEDLIILGNYQTGKDGAVTQRLIVKNLSFA